MVSLAQVSSSNVEGLLPSCAWKRPSYDVLEWWLVQWLEREVVLRLLRNDLIAEARASQLINPKIVTTRPSISANFALLQRTQTICRATQQPCTPQALAHELLVG